MRVYFPSLCLLLLAAPLSSVALSSAGVTTTTPPLLSLTDFDYNSNDRLPWIQDGYNNWKWRGHDINYIEMGDSSKPALVLIHGFGASSYHWRYNIPVLARDYHVFAFCKLGFGLSSKPILDYTPEVWRDQTVDFLKELVQKPATLAGNSL